MPGWSRPSTVALLAMLGPALGIGTAPAAAQTRFETMDTTVHWERYTSLEECIVAVERAGRTGAAREVLRRGLWNEIDTTAPDVKEHLRPPPQEVAMTAQRCSERLSPAQTVPLEDYDHYATLYDQAKRDEAIDTLVKRKLAASEGVGAVPLHEAKSAADSARTRARLAALDSVLSRYQGAEWVKWVKREGAWLERLQEERLLLTTSPEELAMGRLRHRLNWARAAGDTVEVKAVRSAMGPEIEKMIGRMREKMRDSATRARPGMGTVSDSMIALWLAKAWSGANELAHQDELDDSLRRSTASWMAARRALAARLVEPLVGPEVAKRIAEQVNFFGMDSAILLKPAPKVVADYWFFRPGDSVKDRPTPGKVSLIAVVETGGHLPDPGDQNGHSCLRMARETQEDSAFGGTCEDFFAVVRRLGKRFPDLQITLVTQTMGWYVYNATTESAKEAELIRHWLYDIAHLPGALAVQTWPVTKMPEPDGRLLRKQRPVFEGENKVPMEGHSILLADREGKVLWHDNVVRGFDVSNGEPALTRLIELLLQQH